MQPNVELMLKMGLGVIVGRVKQAGQKNSIIKCFAAVRQARTQLRCGLAEV